VAEVVVGLVVVVDEVAPREEPAGQVGMGGVDPGVDDGQGQVVRSDGHVPGLGEADQVGVRRLRCGEARVVGDSGGLADVVRFRRLHPTVGRQGRGHGLDGTSGDREQPEAGPLDRSDEPQSVVLSDPPRRRWRHPRLEPDQNRRRRVWRDHGPVRNALRGRGRGHRPGQQAGGDAGEDRSADTGEVGAGGQGNTFWR
jgi:hypothetical protein